MDPTTDTTQCCYCCYPRLINKKNLKLRFTSPTESLRGSHLLLLLSPTERVTVFCLSHLASRLPHRRSPHRRTPTTKQVFFSNALCSVSLPPLLCFDLFFRLLLLSIFESFLLVFFTWWTCNLKDLSVIFSFLSPLFSVPSIQSHRSVFYFA